MTVRPIAAAVQRRLGELSIESLHLRGPGPDQVCVRISACAVCHSDLSFIDGDWAVRFPAVWGHEASGVVTEVGAGVDSVRPGDRVVVGLLRSCGACRRCRRGMEAVCDEIPSLPGGSPLTDARGERVSHGLGTAAFAEAVTVHRSQVVPLADDIGFVEGALLGCGFLTGAGAVFNTARVEPRSHVVVIGAGGVGASIVQAARLADADRVIAVDPAPVQRSASVGFGATSTVDPLSSDALAHVRTVTDGAMADYVFLATGAGSALPGALELLAPGGALVLVGLPPDGTELVIDPTALAVANRRILGSRMGSSRFSQDVPRLIEHIRAGRLDMRSMVTATFPFERISDAVEGVRAGEAIRNVLLFGDARDGGVRDGGDVK